MRWSPRSTRRKIARFVLLDAAGGTGDIAFRVLAAGGEQTARDCLRHQCRHARGRARARQPSRRWRSHVTGRSASREIDDRITFTEANAEALPFADRTFDAVTIAFGIRNVTAYRAALEEAFRVLQDRRALFVPGIFRGRRSRPQSLYDFYSFRVIPALGGAVAGDAESYRYLVESIRRFPKPQDFAAMMRAAGFARVSFQRAHRRHCRAAFRLAFVIAAPANFCVSVAPASFSPAKASSA